MFVELRIPEFCFAKLLRASVLQGIRADQMGVEEEQDHQYEEFLKHNARLFLFEYVNSGHETETPAA